MIEKTGEVLGEYFSLIKDMFPLVLVTASLTFTIGLHYVKRSYLQRTFWQVLGNLVFSSVMAAMLAICIVCLSELVFPAISAKMELGIAVFVGLFGIKGIDAFLRRKFNMGVVDFMNPDDTPSWVSDLPGASSLKKSETKKPKEENHADSHKHK